MKGFMDKEFLLETETARKLFHDYAENTPVIALTSIILHRSASITTGLVTVPACLQLV